MRVIKILLVLLVFRPLAWIMFGVGIRARLQIPKRGPAVIVSNHNSHLDSFVLISLLPIREIGQARLAGAADYFLKNRFLSRFYSISLEMIPIERKGQKKASSSDELDSMLSPIYKALEEKAIVIYFPEGTRGDSEVFSPMKKGIARIAERFPEVPIVPVSFYGLGKALPKGESLPIPYNVDVRVGKTVFWTGVRDTFLKQLQKEIEYRHV